MAVIRLRKGDGVEKLVEAVERLPPSERVIVEVEAEDPAGAVERVRDFLTSNIGRTVVVYAKKAGEAL